MDVKIEHNLDVRGMVNPLALLKVRKAFREINPGETLEILIGDSETQVDLLRVLSSDACLVRHLEEINAGGSYYRIQLEKRKL